MKIDATKFKEVKVNQILKWEEDNEYGKKGDDWIVKTNTLAFSGLMLGNGYLKNSFDNTITQNDKPSGQHIVVLDRGFVYVGNVSINGDYVNIKDAQCIRVWGTTSGLSQLINGPTSSTKLDNKCDVVTTIKSVIHFIKCKGF